MPELFTVSAVHGGGARAAPPPALTALVLYLRPAPRRAILELLADLGIRVVEHQGRAGAREVARAAATEMTLLVPDIEADQRDGPGLIPALDGPLVVCLKPGTATVPYFESGAELCLFDDDLGPAALAALARVAGEARALRANAAPSVSPRPLFGDLAYDGAQAALRRGSKSVALSRSERAVLDRLCETRGKPVELDELERAAIPEGMSVQPGFLKAVILRLRRKAEELGGDPLMLRTVRGFGYVLTG